MDTDQSPLLALTPYQARTATAIFARLFPGDPSSPGATEIGVCAYLDRALAGPYRDLAETYRLGLAAIDRAARQRHTHPFAACSPTDQDRLLADLEQGSLPDFTLPSQTDFFALLRAHLQEGLFADPVHGGNRDTLGWQFLGHPGIYFENSAEENLAPDPVTKDGVIRSLADIGRSPAGPAPDPIEIPGYDPGKSVEAPTEDADVVLVGVGAMGSLAAHLLARAGLRVVGLEAGPWRSSHDYLPDELTSAYYCRGDMGHKFLSETPRWRRHPNQPTIPAVFSLGRMMNGVGGSVIHWGGALRRCHPHHFTYRTHILQRDGRHALPPDNTLVDWPLTYDDLEPYYSSLEWMIGVAGDTGSNPFIPRSRPFPLPPLRPFTGGRLFEQAARGMGLHPYPTPVAVNSLPYNGYPATSYCAWMGGFGPFADDRWHPGQTWIPQALSTGNFTLRTHCRVLRLLTDPAGRAAGVEYIDPTGTIHTQRARTVILCSYTFENIRLLLLSADTRHPDGLGNSHGQVGKHFMIKNWTDVHGFFPDIVFNAHTGPSGQMWGLDDFIAEHFDSAAHGFIGGATPNIENQRLPIQISREALPPTIPTWGHSYKEHIRQWQHIFAVRIQPETLSYQTNSLDLDPHYRDRSGLGLPLIRITYDIHDNELRQADWMENKGEEILRAMGATTTWRGPHLCRVCSSHDLGGCRMGEDPHASVVDPDLQVHDTPGLYVFSGAVFPTCPGVNPTLTMWALCYRASERLLERLRQS
jgi:gluconate 2-dehydrogenase alpha chain